MYQSREIEACANGRLDIGMCCRGTYSSQFSVHPQAERTAQHRAEEAAERAALMEQYAAADRVEQLGAQRARLKVAEHRREVEALLAAKRAAFEQEQARNPIFSHLPILAASTDSERPVTDGARSSSRMLRKVSQENF